MKIKFPKEILDGIEKNLIEEKKRIERQITDLASQDPFSDTDRLVDNAASDTEAKEEINHERYQAMLAEVKTKLEEIESSLKRIKKGNYGYCIKCKQMIDTDRLAAIPTATLCMDCCNKTLSLKNIS